MTMAHWKRIEHDNGPMRDMSWKSKWKLLELFETRTYGWHVVVIDWFEYDLGQVGGEWCILTFPVARAI